MRFHDDPRATDYADQAAVRATLSEAFEICTSCRRCTDYCGVFPTLFDLLDPTGTADGEALQPGEMTPAQQDHVTDGCTHCGLCTVGCPSGPEHDPDGLDMARLMLRVAAMRRANRHFGRAARRMARIVARPGVVGSAFSRAPGVVNAVLARAPGSRRRRVVAAATGISAQRLVHPFTGEAFSTWFRRRPRVAVGGGRRPVSVVATCIVEYQEPALGRDLLRVFERNGIGCSVAGVACCGAPSLHAGDVDGFARIAARNVARLVRDVRSGHDIIVTQPSCLLAIRRDYPHHVPAEQRADAQLVADHAVDPCDHLMSLHRSDESVLDTDFDGDVPERVRFHASSSGRVVKDGFPGRDLLRLAGSRVDLVAAPAGVDGLWGLRADADDVVAPAAAALVERLEVVDADGASEVVSDCRLAARVLEESTGRTVRHPLQVLARAYGLSDET